MEKIAEKITMKFYENDLINKTDYNIYRYGVQIGLEILCSFIASLMVAIWMKMFASAMVFFAIFIPLRMYLGGFHLKSYWTCFLCSLFTLVGLLGLSKYVLVSKAVAVSVCIFGSLIILGQVQYDKSTRNKNEEYIHVIRILILIDFLAGMILLYLQRTQLLFMLGCTISLAGISKTILYFKDSANLKRQEDVINDKKE